MEERERESGRASTPLAESGLLSTHSCDGEHYDYCNPHVISHQYLCFGL